MKMYKNYIVQYLLNQTIGLIVQMIEQRISKIQQSAQSSHEPAVIVPLTAEAFLFKQMVIDILSHCKKNIKSPPFDDMQVDRLLQTNQTRAIDIYHQYFLIGIANTKTREVVCSRIERLIRESIVNKDSLPAQMITGIINARTVTGGGSTASSGSVVGSAMNLTTQRSLEIGKLIATIICHTLQSSSEISSGLLFLLEGCRNKNNGNSFSLLIEDVYVSLAKYRKKPIDRFLSHFVSKIVSEVQYHESQYLGYQKKYLSQRRSGKGRQILLGSNKYNQAPSIMRDREQGAQVQVTEPPLMHEFILKGVPYNCKEHLCIHPNEEEAKFGKCFICERGANNYDKNLFVPLCSMDCKGKLKRINQQCLINDHFVFVKWIIEMLVSSNSSPGTGDQVLYSLLVRELREGQRLCKEDITQILEIIVNNFSLQAIGITSSSQNLQSVAHLMSNKIIESSAMIMSVLARKYTGVLFGREDQPEAESEGYFHRTKVILTQMIRLLESLSISSHPLQLALLRSVIEIMSSRDSSTITLKQLYLRCDCRILQSNLVERVFNVLSQYALYTTNSSPANNPSMQNLGTTTSLGSDSTNIASLASITTVSASTNTCNDVAIAGLDELLSSIVKVIDQFSLLQHGLPQNKDIMKQKKVKKYLQTKFIEDFNKKPGKAVDSLRKIFDQITAKEIAVFIKDNMDYETKIKKISQKINRQQVGAFFGTTKKDKNAIMDDFNQEVYKQFLKLLQNEYEGRQIDDCLRITFNSFMMPKQGQQVEVVLAPLSLALEPFLGMKVGKQALATYQLIMVVLMVQTSTNPNVKENEKLNFDGFKKFCADIDENFTETRMAQIFDRVKKRPLQIFMEYRGADVFYKKYLEPRHLKAEFWKYLANLSLIEDKKDNRSKKVEILQKAQKQQLKNQNQGQEGWKKNNDEEGQSKSSIEIEQEGKEEAPQNFLAFTFLNLWQYIYMTIVNRQNMRGLEQSCILYGRCQLLKEFEAFFSHLYKMHVELQQRSSNTLQSISYSCKLTILKLAIDYSNCVIGRQSWLIVIKIIHKLDTEEEKKSRVQSPKKNDSIYASYQYEASDKLFTRTNIFESRRLKEFLEAMCQFSSSEVKTDVNYTRQMYILHHIAQIIEYNLQRFESPEDKDEPSLWKIVWPTIRSYFRNICLHPRKEICMSAIDSLKQLTMKMIKLKSKKQMNEYEINHTELISIYLYIFERSPSYIKDLIINILLNVVCREMRSGWEELYTMLELSDSEDNTVVMKVVNRLVRDVQLDNLTNPLRLHQIVLKQLRIAQDLAQYHDIVDILWQICLHFDRLDIWLETLSKVKDIYKSSTQVTVLYFLYRICNRCILTIQNKCPKSMSKSVTENKQRKDSAEQIEDKLQLQYIKETLEEQEKIHEQKRKSLIIDANQAHKLIYFEVFSVQMHILEIRNPKLFVDSISAFKSLSLDVFFRNIGNDNENRTGFLALWEMFITSSVNSVHFSYFLNDYFGLIFKNLAEIKSSLIQNQSNLYSIGSVRELALIKRQIVLWLVRLFMETSKDEVLQLSQEDQDLRKGYQEILEQKVNTSNKTQLIEFYLSSKQYEGKCIQHLVLLKIFKLYFQYQSGLGDEQVNLIGDANMRVLEVVIESYETAIAVNNKPLLRHFLWNNEFFKGHDYLPGLMKQELRSYELILKYFRLQDMKGKVYSTIIAFLRGFIKKSILLSSKYPKPKISQPKIAVPNKPQTVSADENQNEAYNRITQTLYQDLGLWVTNSDQLVCLTLRKICKTLKQYPKDEIGGIDQRELFNLCIEMSRVGNSEILLKECSLLLEQLVTRIY